MARLAQRQLVHRSCNQANSEIINGRTMLPLRFVTESLGATVGWDVATQTITITYAP